MGRGRNNGRVRIIGGRWRGRRIEFPDVPGLRPTPDRVRETVFNWLAPYVAGARVLDLFAGSGALGFEALSRGAASVVAVDSDRRVGRALRAAAEQLEAGPFSVVSADAIAFLARPHAGPFDLVFLDPPHASQDYERYCSLVSADAVLAPAGMVYLELATPGTPDFSTPESWTLYRTARAGHLTYQLWQRTD